MPSLLHELYAYAVPRLRGAGEIGSVAAERARVERWHATPEMRERVLPTRLVPRFDRRYEVDVRRIPFPVHTIRPRGQTPRTTLYYLHGGAYVAPADPAHVRYAVRLGGHLDAEVVIPDYPLAPGSTWRDSHEALVDDLAAHIERQERVVVSGDSAGGGLALALVQTLRDRGAALPTHLVLNSPWSDLTAPSPETRALDAVDPWLYLSKLEPYAAWWAGDAADLARHEVSPGLGDLSGLPPTLVVCGTRDLLAPSCRRLADRAAVADWPLTYLEAPGLIHVFPLLPALPEARRARHHTERFLS